MGSRKTGEGWKEGRGEELEEKEKTDKNEKWTRRGRRS